MTPANYSNVGGGRPGRAEPHGQMQVPQQQDQDNQQVMDYIVHALKSQGPFTNWRADIIIEERANNVYHVWTSLRLIRPYANIRSLAQAALNFEQKSFHTANEKVDYDKDINDKLVHIRETQARQAAPLQQNSGTIAQPGHAAGINSEGQAPFPQQMDRSVQASSMPGQQQLEIGVDDAKQLEALLNRALQLLQQHLGPRQQQPQAIPQQQQAQQTPSSDPPLIDDLRTLSAQEYDNVCRIADQILAKTSQEDINKIKMHLDNMTVEQRQYLRGRNMEPITYFFRWQALSQLKKHRKARRDAQRAQLAQLAQEIAVGLDSEIIGT
ncbi:hypothetical protein BDV30DRAFT_216785 [Aspergillus minisclerotigenes]|uniref:Mediator complex subunit 15 KIX domain-containing protein n=1 Tax=Aspergillus minisclerotigenes TaxID=656917 RepID=A0A5N6IS04_9EURO|nr:hypothetical protein BDV30DRAFT_216785 [Aspergillus minisclerotigenes]